MSRYYYIEKYITRFDKCFDEAKVTMQKLYDDLDDKCMVEAIEHFEEVADVDEIVGYYLAHYGNEAYQVWKENTKYIEMSDNDREIDRILREVTK